MAVRSHVLDVSVTRRGRGRLLTGGTPGRQLRLSAAGSSALDGLLVGLPPRGGATKLGERLVELGMLHPLAAPAAPGPEVTTVLPVLDGGPELGALVLELRRFGPVIVVDDGSADGSPEQAAAAGAQVLRTAGRRGPASARNAGLAAAGTELVGFLDADCGTGEPWPPALGAMLLEDQRLAVVAPRVRSAPGPGLLARYESAYSPLDLGPDQGLVGPGRRLAFVPSTALVVRRSALLDVGGFDERLRFGEDVDLMLRLGAGGWRIRYAPELAVRHRPRSDLAALARQRFEYGRSATALDRRHPGQVAPLRVNKHVAAVWAATALGAARGSLAPAALSLAGSTALAAKTGTSAAARCALADGALRAHVGAARQLSRALVRDWMPLSAGACLVSPRARRLIGLALALDTLASARANANATRLGLSARLGLRVVDHLAYSAGLWRGIAGARSLGASLPRAGSGERKRPLPTSSRPT